MVLKSRNHFQIYYEAFAVYSQLHRAKLVIQFQTNMFLIATLILGMKLPVEIASVHFVTHVF